MGWSKQENIDKKLPLALSFQDILTVEVDTGVWKGVGSGRPEQG